MNTQLATIIAETIEIDPEELTESFDVSSSDAWDSLSIVIVLSRISEEMGLNVSVEEMQEITTLADIERIVEEKKN